MKLYVVNYNYSDPDENKVNTFDCVYLNKENAENFIDTENVKLLNDYLEKRKSECERFDMEYDEEDEKEMFFEYEDFYSIDEIETVD